MNDRKPGNEVHLRIANSDVLEKINWLCEETSDSKSKVINKLISLGLPLLVEEVLQKKHVSNNANLEDSIEKISKSMNKIHREQIENLAQGIVLEKMSAMIFNSLKMFYASQGFNLPEHLDLSSTPEEIEDLKQSIFSDLD